MHHYQHSDGNYLDDRLMLPASQSAQTLILHALDSTGHEAHHDTSVVIQYPSSNVYIMTCCWSRPSWSLLDIRRSPGRSFTRQTVKISLKQKVCYIFAAQCKQSLLNEKVMRRSPKSHLKRGFERHHGLLLNCQHMDLRASTAILGAAGQPVQLQLHNSLKNKHK